MAASGFTPIQLYYSTTATNVPLAANLVAGELAINTADGKLYYKNVSGVVTLLGGLSGFSGISGFSGFSGSGISGFSGISGYSGFSGINGASGISGFSGASGISGFSGASGISGFSGASGISGINGASGISGFSGASGISGYSGTNGTIGVNGASGFSGYSGASGFSGINGTGGSGSSGFSGYSGFSGSGISGYSGLGLSGYSGAQGASGFSGYSGYSGRSGYSGFNGLSGISGYSGSGISGYSGSGISGYSGFSGYSGVISYPTAGIVTSNGLAFGSVPNPLQVGSGGTGLTALTAGLIPFGNSATQLGSSSLFNWSTANVQLGVGIAAPIATLHARGGNSNNAVIDNDGSQFTTLSWYNNGTLRAQGYYDASNLLFVFGTDVAAPVIFKANGTEGMRLSNGGGVSIGTATGAGVGNLLVSNTVTATTVGVTTANATTVNATNFKTTNFTITESGGQLLFKNGTTTIAALDSSGNFVTLGTNTAGGTP